MISNIFKFVTDFEFQNHAFSEVLRVFGHASNCAYTVENFHLYFIYHSASNDIKFRGDNLQYSTHNLIQPNTRNTSKKASNEKYM